MKINRVVLYIEEISGQTWRQSMMTLLLNANKVGLAARQKQLAFSAD
ncbi:hypothetical protein [Janthinobacterium fluminis]|uniref:Uncharacterized protein n=1 Tax=Janthinobacterium fluminis TaxID=2987524 RepID=A0ABT5K359_9BURK|nr:hypothetical protein [Janthinobacterium fluminis]MDC8758833.1 hypothetical protein [Janthinobacterium fluminis]